MRGEKEKACFERIEQQACKKNDVRLLSLWKKAKANSDSNAFPDFVLPDGFIEHFQITAANETQKGSMHNIAEKEFERESKAVFKQRSKEFLNSPPRVNAKAYTYDMRVETHDMISPEYSYESFENSFKRNFKKHIRHLQNYNGDKTNGVFLIELVGARVTIERNGCMEGFYRLSRDYNLLSYVYGYSEEVRYVIFADDDDYELIETKDISARLQYIPKDITIGVGQYHRINLNLFIDI